MTKHPAEIAAVRGVLEQGPKTDFSNPDWVAELRTGYEGMGINMPLAEGVSVEAVTLGGVRGQKLTPSTAKKGRTLLYFHGGGYVIGSPQSHQGMVSQIATVLGAVTYSMDYRMAPEHVFPAAVDDGLASYRGLLELEIAPENILISGDSAGGGLIMALAVSIRDAGLELPAGLMPISPWVNLANDGPTYRVKADSDPMVTQTSIDVMAKTYLGDADAKTPLASPLGADLNGLPPMLIQVGSEEVLLSDSTMLAARAGAAKVDVTLQIWPEMVHVFHFFYPMLTDARKAIDDMARWADRYFA